jgi:hypothetical protein
MHVGSFMVRDATTVADGKGIILTAHSRVLLNPVLNLRIRSFS